MKSVKIILPLIVVFMSCGFTRFESSNYISSVIKISSESLQEDTILSTLWCKNFLLSTYPLKYIKIDSSFKFLEDSSVCKGSNPECTPLTMSMNKARNKVLYVVSKFRTKSMGALVEKDLYNNQVKEIINSSENISSAVYFGGTDSIIVYYSLGKPEGVNAGYFKMDLKTNKRVLIFDIYSDLGSDEIVNGFDVSPDGNTLLVPEVFSKTTPKILMVEMSTGQVRWVQELSLDVNRELELLWMRYNNDGTEVLYSIYSRGLLGNGPKVSSKLGVIKLETMEDKLLQFKPEDASTGAWVAPFPNWSPDNKHIIYGMICLGLSNYELYIKTNIELETNKKTILKVKKITSKTLESKNLENAVWTNNFMLATYSAQYIKIDSNYSVIEDSSIGDNSLIKYYPFTMSLNKKKTKIVYVVSNRSSVSIGALYEMDLQNDYALKELLDSSENISSAVYMGSSDSLIVYYSLGKPEGRNAGYYKLNLNTMERELILEHYSSFGRNEIVNGFDISPDGKNLLFTDVGSYRPPIIVSYNLETKRKQALYQFDSPNRALLWMRYNIDGTKILYSNYGQRAFIGGPCDPSKLGVLNLKSLEDKNIVFKPDNSSWDRWTASFPNWSPDNKHIVYGMALIADKSGAVGSYHLYVRINIDEEISSVLSKNPKPRVMKLE